jgi:6-phosphogluconate dehydrogenase
MSIEPCDLGVIGMSAIGQSFAAHHATAGIRVVVCDTDDTDQDGSGDVAKTNNGAAGGSTFLQDIVNEYQRTAAATTTTGTTNDPSAMRCMIPASSIEQLIPMLQRPRRIVICGTHGYDGKFIYLFQHCLAPLLEEGDIVLRWGREEELGFAYPSPDEGGGGGEGVQFYENVVAGFLYRLHAHPKGVHLLEMVRLRQDRITSSSDHSSFLIGGGTKEACAFMSPYLTAFAASLTSMSMSHVGNDPSCAHYAIMIQRTIENGIAQIYAEGSDILRKASGYENQDIGRTFRNWNERTTGGLLTGFLTGITSKIYYKRDVISDTGFIVDKIKDSILSEPVDTWATLEATRLNVPAPTINAALSTRFLSVMKDERVEASTILKVPDGNDTPSVLKDQICEDLQRAMYCACLSVVAECLAIFEAASDVGSWDINVVECIRLWNLPGSFLQSTLLDKIHMALLLPEEDHTSYNSLLTISSIATELQDMHMSWRRIVTVSFASAIAVPTISASLAHYDSYRSGKMPIGLTRAQRDYYDASGYDRLGEEGWYSTCWVKEHTALVKKEKAAVAASLLSVEGGVKRSRKI